MISEEIYTKAIEHLKKDPLLKKVIENVKPAQWRSKGDYLENLVESIVSQQLSIKSADAIFFRLQDMFPNKKISAEGLIELSIEQLRKTGLSRPKIGYIKDLAQKTIESPKIFEQFDQMSDEEIIAELIKIKGVGRWTAEMFLIFTMQRLDVFSYGDLGIRKAIQRLYGFKKEPTQKQAEKIAKKWKPYRSVACRYLWKSLEIVI